MKFDIGDIVKIKEGVEYMVTTPGTRWVVYGYWAFPNSNALLLKVGTLPKDYQEFIRVKDIMLNESADGLRRRIEIGMRRYSVLEDEVEFDGKMGTNQDFKDMLSQGDIWEQEVQPVRPRGFRVSDYATSYMEVGEDLPF